MVKGIFFIALFGIFFLRGSWGWFWMFPLFFIGVLPLLKHLTHSNLREDIHDRGEEDRQDTDERFLEKQVLKSAKKNDGRLTPALVALDSSLSIEEAETILQSFVKRGYATMEVTDSGQIEYRFAEFLPPGGSTAV